MSYQNNFNLGLKRKSEREISPAREQTLQDEYDCVNLRVVCGTSFIVPLFIIEWVWILFPDYIVVR